MGYNTYNSFLLLTRVSQYLQLCSFQHRKPRQGRFCFFQQTAAVRAMATPAQAPGSASATGCLTEHQGILPALAKNQDEYFKTFTSYVNTLLHTAI